MEFLLRKDGDIILWTGQAAAAAAVPTTAPNSFYAIPSVFATNLSLAWAEGPAPDTKMGGKCRFSFKSS
jgi:hypothetical protein